MRTTLLIPTINEIEGVKAVMPRIKREWVDEIIIVDGNSTDGTHEYALENGYRVIRQKSKGAAKAYLEALAVTTGDVILTFSPDGNCIPEDIPRLVDKMKEGFDMVIASRYLDSAKSEDDDFVTAFGNWFFTKTINFLFGGNYTDSLVNFRAWKREIISSFRIDPSHAGLEPQLCIECAKQKLKVTEIPSHEPKRIGGIRKMSPLRNGWAILVLIVKELFLPASPSVRN